MFNKDILSHIFVYFNGREIFTLSLVCKAWLNHKIICEKRTLYIKYGLIPEVTHEFSNYSLKVSKIKVNSSYGASFIIGEKNNYRKSYEISIDFNNHTYICEYYYTSSVLEIHLSPYYNIKKFIEYLKTFDIHVFAGREILRCCPIKFYYKINYDVFDTFLSEKYVKLRHESDDENLQYVNFQMERQDKVCIGVSIKYREIRISINPIYISEHISFMLDALEKHKIIKR